MMLRKPSQVWSWQARLVRETFEARTPSSRRCRAPSDASLQPKTMVSCQGREADQSRAAPQSWGTKMISIPCATHASSRPLARVRPRFPGSRSTRRVLIEAASPLLRNGARVLLGH